MSGYENIRFEIDGPIADIVFDRPETMNAINHALKVEVAEALQIADRDPNVRVVILSGTEESRAFSTGYDLKPEEYAYLQSIGEDVPEGGRQGHDTYGWRRLIERSMRFELMFWEYRKPIIAQVHGYCLAGACEIAMLADMTIAADDLIIGEPEIRFMTGPPVMIMPWVVGIKRAKQMLFTGETIDAATALEWGMVNMVVPRAELREATLRYARKLAVVPTEALHYTKSAINRGMEAGGLRNTVELAFELTSMLDATSTDFGREFHRRREEAGLGPALKWTKQQFEGPH